MRRSTKMKGIIIGLMILFITGTVIAVAPLTAPSPKVSMNAPIKVAPPKIYPPCLPVPHQDIKTQKAILSRTFINVCRLFPNHPACRSYYTSDLHYHPTKEFCRLFPDYQGGRPQGIGSQYSTRYPCVLCFSELLVLRPGKSG